MAHILNIDPNTVCRVTFNEITKDAVKNAIKEPRKIDMDLTDAQQARRVLDRIVGYKISPVLWKKVQKGLSAGRVQSVAVRLIVEREEEIENFKPEEYWNIYAKLKDPKSKKSFQAKFYGKDNKKIDIHSEDEVNKIVNDVEKYASEDAIIASSTSGLLITEIAKNAKHPERFIGAHPYNPPHLIPLVEITKGEKTKEENVQLAYDLYKSIKKEPVILQKEALGFICNRIQMAVYREVSDLVMRGVCSIEDADKAVTYGPGIRWAIMGPSLVFELGGGQGHIDGLMNHLNDSIKLWLNDMADWKEFPEQFPEIAREGVEESLKNRPKEIGNTDESLAEYRDKMLIEILKLHNKL